MLQSLIAGAIAGYGSAIPVGPVAVLIIELGVRRGLRLAAAAGLGAATADGLYALLAVLAGARIAELLGPVTPALQLLAVVVLFGIAIRGVYLALYHARIGIPGNAELPTQPGRTYLRFLAITLLNPTYMEPLYHSSTGHMLIVVGLVMMGFGSLLLKKIVSFKG